MLATSYFFVPEVCSNLIGLLYHMTYLLYNTVMAYQKSITFFIIQEGYYSLALL